MSARAAAAATPSDWYGPTEGPDGVLVFLRSCGMTVELRDHATGARATLPRDLVELLDDDALAHELAQVIARAADPWQTLGSGLSALRHRRAR